MIFEYDFNFSPPHACNAGIFGHAHIDVGHGTVGKLDRQFHTGAQLATGSGRTTRQRIDGADFNNFGSRRTGRDNQSDSQG